MHTSRRHRSRAAFTGMLVAGLLLTGGSATMAVTGIAGDGSASIAQYTPPGPVTPSGTPTPADVIGPQQTNTVQSPAGGDQGSSAPTGAETPADDGTQADQDDVAGRQESSPEDGTATPATRQTVSPAAQTTAAVDTDARLPFTGVAVFPLLLCGLALVATGGLMRLRLGREQSQA